MQRKRYNKMEWIGICIQVNCWRITAKKFLTQRNGFPQKLQKQIIERMKKIRIKTSVCTKIRLPYLLAILGLVSSCGPNREEKALEVFCRTEGPQLIIAEEYSDVSKDECFFYNNSFYLGSIYVYTDRDVIEFHFDSTNDDDIEQMKDIFKTQGEELLLDMASSNKRIKIILKQTQKVGYELIVNINLDDVISFDKETISKWNLK